MDYEAYQKEYDRLEEKKKKAQEEYDRLEKCWPWIYALWGIAIALQLIAIIGKAVSGQ